MQQNEMSSIIMHVLPSDTNPESLILRPMGEIYVHASVAAHDTTLDNSNVAARDMFLEI